MLTKVPRKGPGWRERSEIAHMHQSRQAAGLLQVTIVPRDKFPLGQTVVKVNEQRELTNLFTRRYLEEQLLTVLAGDTSAASLPAV